MMARTLILSMSIPSVLDLKKVKSNVKGLVEGTLADTGGLLRLAPAWVPRSFLQPVLSRPQDFEQKAMQKPK